MNDLIVVQKIAGWEKLKALVPDSISSPITKRLYKWRWTSSRLAAGDATNDACQTKSVQAQLL